MPLSRWVPYVSAIQYSGSNSAEILGLIPNGFRGGYAPAPAYIVSESGGTVTFRQDVPEMGSAVVSLVTGDWIQIVPGDAGLAGCTPRNAAVSPISDWFTAIRPPTITQEETGAVALPSLLLNGSTSVVVPLSGSFPTTTYQVRRRAVAGVTVLSTLTFSETSRTVSSITYTVTASGLATAAGLLLVDAYSLSS